MVIKRETEFNFHQRVKSMQITRNSLTDREAQIEPTMTPSILASGVKVASDAN
jgi:hypothetical protein